jgi:hypothetical protein
VSTLQDHLLPFMDHHHRDGAIFQQDNAAIHTSRLTKAWFSERNMTVLDWPAKSPDLNPIENMWGVLARRVYAGGRQFQSRKELIRVILREWEGIEPLLIKNLIVSMPKRVGSVLELQGGKTKY